MKKTIEQAKKSSYMVVASTILDKKQPFEFCFDEKECQSLANRFDLPNVLSFKAQLNLYRDEFVHVKGEFQSQVVYQSVVSLEEFPSTLHEKFDVLMSEGPPSDSDEIIDKIERGRIDLKEILFEQFGLSLDPFPKKETETENFVYQEDVADDNPFQKLKDLIQK